MEFRSRLLAAKELHAGLHEEIWIQNLWSKIVWSYTENRTENGKTVYSRIQIQIILLMNKKIWQLEMSYRKIYRYAKTFNT